MPSIYSTVPCTIPIPCSFLSIKSYIAVFVKPRRISAKLRNWEKQRYGDKGTDATIITYGMGVHWAQEEAKKWAKEGIELEVVDLRCLAPLDLETVKKSVAKTNKVLLLQEPSTTLGPMSELSALITETCFEELDAPVMRCSSLDMPVPFNPNLEQEYLADSRLKETIGKLIRY